MNDVSTHRADPSRGFTLVELLVVIGIIALLMGILLPTLGNARRAASQMKSLSNIRQLSMGFEQYQLQNKGSIPFGYPPPVVSGVPTRAELPSGHTIAFPVASRYPWRLVNYVGDVWGMIHSHKDLPDIPMSNDSNSVAEAKAYTLSLAPTYGMNSFFVGGHSGYHAFDPITGAPNHNGPAVFKGGHVRRPSELIVFGDSTATNIPNVGEDDGYFILTPPRRTGQMWKVEGRKCVPVSGMAMGLPQGRYGRGAAIAFFDGHVATLQPEELLDMRLWTNRATAPDWDYRP